jgi:hypothetical protein
MASSKLHRPRDSSTTGNGNMYSDDGPGGRLHFVSILQPDCVDSDVGNG